MSLAICILLAVQTQGDPWLDRMRMIRSAYESLGPCSFESTITTETSDADGKKTERWLKTKTFFGNRLNWRVEQVSHSSAKGDEAIGNELWCEQGQIHAYIRTEDPPRAMDLGDLGNFIAGLSAGAKSEAWGFAGFPSMTDRLLLGLTDWMQGYGISADLSQMLSPKTGASMKLSPTHWIVEESEGTMSVSNSDPTPLKDWQAAVHYEPHEPSSRT